MYKQEFAYRLSRLREHKGVSARDMSLSIGQNAGYINNIECGKALPSMSSFFYICDFLNISPAEFFATDQPDPDQIRHIVDDLKRLDPEDLACIRYMARRLAMRGAGKDK